MANNNVETTLSQYAWDKRQLIVFTPNETYPEYIKFKQALSESVFEIKDRKLHTWHVIKNKQVRLNTKIINEFTNTEIRSTYGVELDEFRVILIGYDQGEKLRQTRSDISDIFYNIDQMPMRIQEIENGKK